MDFRVLGPLEVQRDGEPIQIGSRMQRRLLTLLLVHAGRSVDADRAIDVLWSQAPPPSASKGLHTYVSRLRRSLGDPDRIRSDAHGYRLSVAEDELDARRFERLVRSAQELVERDPAAAATRFADALALWRGAAYAGVADEEFARADAVRLEQLRLATTEDAFSARLAAGDQGLVPDIEAFVDAHPLRERAYGLLMIALGRAGRQTDALEVFQRARSRLADEAGLDPSPALTQLQDDLLRQAPHVTATAGPRTDPPERPGGVEVAAGNLPQPVTSFVGRRHETEAVCRLLEREHLVTLTGVGGVGKTRLALQAAAVVAEHHPDGVWWCELAPADPGAVSHVVADVLGVHRTTQHSVVDSIVGALAGKRLLLVLDNCEHVVEAGARLAERVLRSCPGVTLLATSREPLGVDGEQVWVVPPLPLPADHADDAAESPSTRLFHDRARSHRADLAADEPTSAAVADICRQLDGLPLAIELAAALVAALEPVEIARRLGTRFRLLTHGRRTDPRHRSLAAVVEWSYQLLEAQERRLFDRLAVFAGGFTLQAAEGVCAGDGIAREQVAGLLTGLVSRSMVQVDRSEAPARYQLLDTLRQYAAERLAERGEEAALRARHAAWFGDLAERADVAVRGRHEAEAVALLESELANLRAVHRWAVEHDDADVALQLATSLYVFARFRLRDEVFAWAEEAADLPSADGHPRQPWVWGIAAHGISNRGDLVRARELAERALASPSAAAGPGAFTPLRVLATIALYEGRLDDCRRLSDEAIASAGREDDDYYRIWLQMHDALQLVYGQDHGAAVEAALVQRAAADELGNPNLRAWALYVHAEACGDQDPEQALQLLEQAIDLAAPIRGRYLEGVARLAMISLRARHRSPREALASFPGIIMHWRRAGDWIHQWTTLRNLVPLLVELGADEPAALLYGAQQAATSSPAYGAEADRLAEAHATLASRSGERELGRLIGRGASLDGEAVIELALGCIAELLDP